MNKTYAFTDLHGMYPLWEQIRDFCDESDKLIFLGDACDRGDDGLKIIKELLQDKRVTYIKGNHEDFLEDTNSFTSASLSTMAVYISLPIAPESTSGMRSAITMRSPYLSRIS